MSQLTNRFRAWKLAATGGAVALAAVLAAVLLTLPGTAAATAGHHHARAHAASATKVSAHKTSVGKILVGPNGHTLYAFSRDHRNKDACVKISGCASVWPPFTAKGHVKAGHGVKRSLLKTISVKGHKQVTYAGHPLYYYVSDEGPHETGYIGVSGAGGTWPAVSPSGKLIK